MDVLGPTPIYDFLSLISAFVVYGNSAITCLNGLIVEEFLQDYQAGEALTTWVASVQIALSFIGGYLAGTLVELYGNRVVTMTGTVVAALGFIATAFTTHVGQLFVTYSLLTGVGIGLQFVPTLVVPQYVFPKRRTLAVAFILAGCSTWTFVLPILFNYFREMYGYRGVLLLWAGVMLNSLPFGMLMTMHPQLKEGHKKCASTENSRNDELGENKCSHREQGLSVKDTEEKAGDSKPICCKELGRACEEMKQGFQELRDGSCRVLVTVVFFYACGFMMPYIFLPGKTLLFGLSKSQAAWLVATIGLSETFGRLVAGIFGFVFKKQLVIFYGVSMLLSGVGCIGMLLSTTFYGFFGSSIIYGTGMGSNVTLYTQAAIAIVGMLKIIRMIGLISLAWGIAHLISPSLGAFVYEVTGNVDVPFYMGSSLQLLAAVVLCSYRISPIYHKRPAVTEKQRELISTDIPVHDAILASSCHSLPPTPQLGTHLSVILRGSASLMSSTESRIYSATGS